jgi:hypothetical protein
MKSFKVYAHVWISTGRNRKFRWCPLLGSRLVSLMQRRSPSNPNDSYWGWALEFDLSLPSPKILGAIERNNSLPALVSAGEVGSPFQVVAILSPFAKSPSLGSVSTRIVSMRCKRIGFYYDLFCSSGEQGKN